MKNFKFYPSAVQHIYQRAVDRGVIFYTDEDRIVYYTISATQSKKYGIVVPAASIMYTHTHQSARARTTSALTKYIQDTSSSFAREYNFHHRRKGQLYDKPPGIAQKVSSKYIRSNIIYVYNNHVEKHLCSRAIEERWSFLAYAFSLHPFSEELDMKIASRLLLKGLRLIDRRVRKNKPLKYADLAPYFQGLSPVEREQFIDRIIYCYGLVGHNAARQYFGNLESMVTAIDSTTGREDDIREEYAREDDRAYREICVWAEQKGLFNGYNRIYSLSESEKFDMMMELRYVTDASLAQLCKFFHSDFKRKH